MITLDEAEVPPLDVLPRPEAGDGARRCTLCLNWWPRDEMIQLNPVVSWCSTCALLHPELVPPPVDVLWPVGGSLAGVLAGCLLAISQTGPSGAIVVNGLIGAILGIGVGSGLWFSRAWHESH